MDDLVERLLEKDAWTNQRPYWHHRNPDGPEAAARITALETALAEAEGRVIADVVAWLRDTEGKYTDRDSEWRAYWEAAALYIENGEWKK